MVYDVVALGEFLIDFMPGDMSPAGNPTFERNAGGAPVNVLAALSRLSKKTAFIGKVGDDPFGLYLRDALVAEGIDDKGLVFTDQAHTTMAFVHLDAQGERSFHFCRKPGADETLSFEEVDHELLSGTRVFHFGSISMTSEPAYTATIQAVLAAKNQGAIITYDPNWRPALWMDDSHARKAMEDGLMLADVIKVSQQELFFLTDCDTLEAGAAVLLNRFPIKLLLVTLDAEGTYFHSQTLSGKVSSYRVTAVDTTGAGDGFMGAFIYKILEAGRPITEWTEEDMKSAISFANAAGALAVTRKGAISSLGTIEEIVRLQTK